MNKTLSIFLSLWLVFLTACGGRAANPIPQYQVDDEEMTCEEIKVEMAHINAQVEQLIPESKKTGKNVALGAAGLFLIFPWFFMDMSSAEKTEIKAYQSRYLAMEKLYKKRNCGGLDQQGGNTSAAPSGDSANERLKILGQLKEDGLITDEEYETRRQEILDSI